MGFVLSFRSSITRQKFEELCEDLWERSLVPLKEVLNYSGLKMDEIYAVELIGGGTRVPKLQVCTILFVLTVNPSIKLLKCEYHEACNILCPIQ